MSDKILVKEIEKNFNEEEGFKPRERNKSFPKHLDDQRMSRIAESEREENEETHPEDYKISIK